SGARPDARGRSSPADVPAALERRGALGGRLAAEPLAAPRGARVVAGVAERLRRRAVARGGTGGHAGLGRRAGGVLARALGRVERGGALGGRMAPEPRAHAGVAREVGGVLERVLAVRGHAVGRLLAGRGARGRPPVLCLADEVAAVRRLAARSRRR